MTTDPIPAQLRQAAREAPLLDAATEADCLARIRENGDREAMATLIRSHLRLAIATATRYAGRGVRIEDLVSEGVLGLCEAVRRYDPEHGTRFATYATWWVRAHVRAHALQNRRLVGLPSTRGSRVVIGRASRVERELTGKLGRPPSVEELAEALGVRAGDVEMVRRAMSPDVPYSPIEDGAGLHLRSEDASPEDLVARAEDADQARRSLRGALGVLDVRELEILERRYLTGEGETLRVVGERMGLSRERVRQLEQRAKKKIRTALSAVA